MPLGLTSGRVLEDIGFRMLLPTLVCHHWGSYNMFGSCVSLSHLSDLFGGGYKLHCCIANKSIINYISNAPLFHFLSASWEPTMGTVAWWSRPEHLEGQWPVEADASGLSPFGRICNWVGSVRHNSTAAQRWFLVQMSPSVKIVANPVTPTSVISGLLTPKIMHLQCIPGLA